MRGQLVTPQNTLTIPHAAHNPTGSPNIGAKKLPSVAPTKRVGTISPPLNPPPKVTAVNSIFKRNTYHAQLVTKLLAIISEACTEIISCAKYVTHGNNKSTGNNYSYVWVVYVISVEL